MKLFIVIAALMSVAAAGAIAWPLWRDRSSRLATLLSTVLILTSAALLYATWSSWDWSGQKQAPPETADVMAMVNRLEQRLDAHPNDLAGWLMLGRSYLTLERFDDAIAAYQHAIKLADTNDAEAPLGLGEAMAMRAGGQITPAAAQLFEDALKSAPQNPKALLFGGFAAAARGDKTLAKTRWLTLKGLSPPPEIAQLLDTRIAELDGPGAAAPDALAPATTADSSTQDAGAQATVRLRIAPDLATRAKPDSLLFVFAQEPGVRGPPLAVKRISASQIGTSIQLSAADSMIPSRTLHSGQKVSITARISFSGQPTPVAGDLYGELTYDVGHDGVRDLIIDHIAQ